VQIPVITIDGPTASGKGTVALGVAQTLAWHFLDSGALYRLTALALERRGHDLASAPTRPDATLIEEAAGVARALNVRFDRHGTWLDDVEVGDLVRQERIGMLASKISAWQPVRDGLMDLQHGFRKAPGLVADGRDMGTVVFPDATLKVFLNANIQVRAERRYKQLIDKGFSVKIESLLDDLGRRDAQDMQRSNAPLKPARDAVLLDTTEMSVAQAIDWVLKRWSLLQP
jgi:cytidylate kinase